eukprot:10103562-Ditylum_brightwellii.AAC.1
MRDNEQLKLLLKTNPLHGVPTNCKENINASERIAEEKCIAAAQAKGDEQSARLKAQAAREEVKKLTQLVRNVEERVSSKEKEFSRIDAATKIALAK